MFLYLSSFLLFVFPSVVVSILLVYLSAAGGLFCSGFNISCLLPIKKKTKKKGDKNIKLFIKWPFENEKRGMGVIV